MVQINRASVRPRTRVAGGNNSLVLRLQSFADTLPYLNQLSPVDRLLVATGLSLVAVVSFSYAFLISGIFSSSVDHVFGGDAVADPRLSPDLRKMGLSDEALLRRGGGRRISIGGRHPLDANENAVALDIIATLNCDALQDEIERDWHTVLDKQRADAEWGQKVGQGWDGGAGDGNDGKDSWSWKGGGSGDAGSGTGSGSGSGSGSRDFGEEGFGEPIDRRRLFEADDVVMNDIADDVGYRPADGPADGGLRLTAAALFCLAADALSLPQATADAAPSPSIHCDVGRSLETRDELLYLWSSARAQMPRDVIERTLRLATEHKETLRGTEVHLWHPDNDKGTEGMLRVLNSGWEGRASYNFDSEMADLDHDDLYRFHSRELRAGGYLVSVYQRQMSGECVSPFLTSSVTCGFEPEHSALIISWGGQIVR